MNALNAFAQSPRDRNLPKPQDSIEDMVAEELTYQPETGVEALVDLDELTADTRGGVTEVLNLGKLPSLPAPGYNEDEAADLKIGLPYVNHTPESYDVERQRKSLELLDKLLKTKGIDLEFRRKDGHLVKQAKLVSWLDPEKFIVVGNDNGQLVKKEFSAEQLGEWNPQLGNKIAEIHNNPKSILTSLYEDMEGNKAQEFRDALAELQRLEAERLAGLDEVKTPTVYDGGEAESLEEGMRRFKTPDGIVGVIATIKGGYKFEKDKTTKEIKDRNEDRVVADPENGVFAVVDGMGGFANGEVSAQIVADEILRSKGDFKSAATSAKGRISGIEGVGKKDGACFLAAQIKVGKPLSIGQSGDVDCYHFSSKGKVKFAPGMQVELGQKSQSSFEYLESELGSDTPIEVISRTIIALSHLDPNKITPEQTTDIKEIVDRVVKGIKPVVPSHNSLFTTIRRTVVNAVTSGKDQIAMFETTQEVEGGDWVAILSDGVSDNFEEGEFEALVMNAIQAGLSPAEATQQISPILNDRIQKCAVNDPEAKKRHFKLDNATIIIMRAEGKDTAGTVRKVA